jgi:hypothetical protein
MARVATHARVHGPRRYQTESDQGSQAVVKRKPTLTCWRGQHHRSTYADRNGKVHRGHPLPR